MTEILERLAYVFHKMLWIDIIFLFFALLMVVGMMVCFLVMPIICHFYIVPQIEKKTSKKLGFSPLFKLTSAGRYLGKATEISKYTIKIYSDYKRYGRRGLPSGFGRCGLKQIGYTVDMVSREELIFSYVYQMFFNLTGIAILVCGAIAFVEINILKMYH